MNCVCNQIKLRKRKYFTEPESHFRLFLCAGAGGNHPLLHVLHLFHLRQTDCCLCFLRYHHRPLLLWGWNNSSETWRDQRVSFHGAWPAEGSGDLCGLHHLPLSTLHQLLGVSRAPVVCVCLFDLLHFLLPYHYFNHLPAAVSPPRTFQQSPDRLQCAGGSDVHHSCGHLACVQLQEQYQPKLSNYLWLSMEFVGCYFCHDLFQPGCLHCGHILLFQAEFHFHQGNMSMSCHMLLS